MLAQVRWKWNGFEEWFSTRSLSCCGWAWIAWRLPLLEVTRRWDRGVESGDEQLSLALARIVAAGAALAA